MLQFAFALGQSTVLYLTVTGPCVYSTTRCGGRLGSAFLRV